MWDIGHVATIISDHSCLVMISDASETAVAVSLFCVLKADASTGTKADLPDSPLSGLVAATHRKLNTWLTMSYIRQLQIGGKPTFHEPGIDLAVSLDTSLICETSMVNSVL